jgi:hypothetical protein
MKFCRTSVEPSGKTECHFISWTFEASGNIRNSIPLAHPVDLVWEFGGSPVTTLPLSGSVTAVIKMTIGLETPTSLPGSGSLWHRDCLKQRIPRNFQPNLLHHNLSKMEEWVGGKFEDFCHCTQMPGNFLQGTINVFSTSAS